MSTPFYGLRAAILTQLIFLIVAAMLLINVAMLKFHERDLIHARINTGRLVIRALEQGMGQFIARKKGMPADIGSNPDLKEFVSQLVSSGGFSDAAVIDHRGNTVFHSVSSADLEAQLLSNAREAVETGMLSTRFSGSTWGVIWLNSNHVLISSPLMFRERPLGGIAIRSSLVPIYQELRGSEKLILLYILLDTVILALAGIYLLSRIAVKPIHQLLKMTEDYTEGDSVPAPVEATSKEIAELSRSLSIMLRRLDENKKELRSHIASLEKANEELQQAQNEIIRSEKLASVGRLAAGIAHEIGNPIGIILGYLELIRKGGIEEDEREDFLNRIQSEVTRINRIIRHLLHFSRPTGGNPERIPVHGLVMNTLEILRPQPMMEGIEIGFALKAARDTVFADPDQLQQVFLNIIMNAADFLSGKDFREDICGSKTLRLESENKGDALMLRFVDNGPGIPASELDRIFDPFYTTKEPGKGTGLGLSVCYRIVEGLGGSITAESAEGRGAAITIVLPLAPEGRGKERVSGCLEDVS